MARKTMGAVDIKGNQGNNGSLVMALGLPVQTAEPNTKYIVRPELTNRLVKQDHPLYTTIDGAVDSGAQKRGYLLLPAGERVLNFYFGRLEYEKVTRTKDGKLQLLKKDGSPVSAQEAIRNLAVGFINPSVSGTHFKIEWIPGQDVYNLGDEKSSNGTRYKGNAFDAMGQPLTYIAPTLLGPGEIFGLPKKLGQKGVITFAGYPQKDIPELDILVQVVNYKR